MTTPVRDGVLLRRLLPEDAGAAAGLQIIAGEGEISNVAVLPNERRRGIAGSLIRIALSEARELGVSDFTLEVREGNTAALSLYESFGFQIEGRRRNYYTNPTEDALIMWRRSGREVCND